MLRDFDINKKIQHFMRFLKERDIYKDYLKYFNSNGNWRQIHAVNEQNIKIFINTHFYNEDIFLCAFDWYQTKQGYTFWCKLAKIYQQKFFKNVYRL